MHRIFIFLSLCFALNAHARGTCAVPVGHFPVSTAGDLMSIALNPSGSYLLCNDIDLAGIDLSPIESFSGKLDGAGFTLSNLTIAGVDTSLLKKWGLFEEMTTEAEVTNLILSDVSVSGPNQVGAIAGRNFGLIENVRVSGLMRGNYKVGGVVGENGGTIRNAGFIGAAVGTGYGSQQIGGLVGSNMGQLERSWTIGFSYAGRLVAAFGEVYVGGLVGQNSFGGVIDQSVAVGDVLAPNPAPSGESYGIGGLVGSMAPAGIGQSSISDSFSIFSKVRGDNAVGGFIGSSGSSAIIKNSYSANDVASYFDVSAGTIYAGAFIGQVSGPVTENCYFDSSQPLFVDPEVSGANPRTTLQMTTPGAPGVYENWDFQDIWSQAQGFYPLLQNLTVP